MTITTRGKRLTWASFERVTEPPRARPAGAIDLPKPKRRTLRVAANDNRQPRGVPFPLPEHTEQRVTPRGKSTPMRIRANLQATAPEAFRTLVRLDELFHPPRVAANDNSPDDIGGTGHERIQNQGSIRPSVPAVLRAYSDGLRPRVVIRRDGTVERFHGGISYETGRDRDEFVQVGGYYTSGEFFGLQFYRGALIAYSNEKGRKSRPWYDATRAAEAIPDEGSETAKHTVHHPGDAGVSEGKGVGEGRTSAAAHEALAEIDRAASAEDFLSKLDDITASRIRRILEADSFSEIALDEGAAPSSAHKVGRRLCIKTLTIVEKLMAA